VGARPGDGPVTVFAAASLKTVLDAVTPTLAARAGVRVRVSYAGTPALAAQIEAGAPADLVVSADTDWMQYLADRGLVRVDSLVALIGNRLVLVAPSARPVHLTLAPGLALGDALGTGRLAVADPSTVPAGKYARAALTTLGVWRDVASRLAPAENVRAALVLVARGEAPLGIVYETDARAEPAVTIVARFPESSHPPIVYPVALTRASTHPAAPRVLEALRSPDVRALFERHGFVNLPG
jgi:molybdate transport system substrate-binding protein